jgi:hypothetical protein
VERLCIAPEDALGGAGLDTGRPLVVLKPIQTQVAFYSKVSISIILHGPKRACLEAFTATNAKRFIKEHHAAFIPEYCLYRA